MCVAWEYFKQQAINKGLTRGRKEGRIETWEKLVIRSLENNLDYETINKITGLSLKKIKEIAVSAKA